MTSTGNSTGLVSRCATVASSGQSEAMVFCLWPYYLLPLALSFSMYLTYAPLFASLLASLFTLYLILIVNFSSSKELARAEKTSETAM